MSPPAFTHTTIFWSQRMALGCFFLVILLGVIGLVSDIPEIRDVVGIRSQLVFMPPVTAIIFVLLSILLIESRRPLTRPLICLYMIVAVLVSLLGLAKTVEPFLLGSGQSLEMLMMGSLGEMDSILVFVISPLAGVLTCLAGIGTLFRLMQNTSRTPSTEDIPGLIGSLVFSGGLIALLGYMHGAPIFYHPGGSISMALTGAIAFLCLGAGLATIGGPDTFPISIFVGSSPRAVMMRSFVPLVGISILFSDVIQELVSEGLSRTYHPFYSALLIVASVIVTITIAVRLGDTIGRNIEAVETARLLAERARLGAERDLRAISLRHEAVLSEIPDIIMEVDARKVYTWANPAGFEFFGSDVIGKEAADYFLGEQNVYGKVQPLFNGDAGTFYVESWQRRKDGERRLLAWWCRALKDADGRVLGAISSARDITEHKRNEEELANYRADLEREVENRTHLLIEVRKELEEKRRLADIGTLSATVAHEIRNPLAAIKIASYNIAKADPENSHKRHIDAINKKIGECDHIIKNFLGYARIVLPQYETLMIAEVLEESVKAIREKYAGWNVDLNVHSCHENCRILRADPLHMSELFMNLLDNAYLALPEKTGRIDVTLTCDEKAERLIMSFKDNGCGMKKEAIDRIFEPFFTTRARGVGLGLTVCRQIVDLHRGTMEVKSEEGRGTEFIITLPLKNGH